MHKFYKLFSSPRFVVYLGHLIFIVHIVFSIVFVYEKTMYADAANFIFNIVNSEDFFIAAGRYGCLPPQFITLEAVKLGMSLKNILLVYSVSYVLYYYLLYNIVVSIYKNARIGLVIAFSLLLCIRHNYFMNHCEMHLAIIYCLLLYSFMEYYYNHKPFGRYVYQLMVILLITLCFFSHPAVLFGVIFVILYHALDKNEFHKVEQFLYMGSIVLLVAGKALFTESNSYEGNLMGQVLNFRYLIFDFFNIYSVKFIITRFLTLYLSISLFGLLVLYWYYKQHMILKLVLLLISTTLFIVVSALIYHQGDSDMMMERAYSMLIVFVMIPFMHDYVAGQKKLGFTNGFLMVVFVVSMVGIYKTGRYYHKRVDYVNALLSQYKDSKASKFLVSRKDLDNTIVIVPWAFAFETLMYSSLEGPGHSKTFYVMEDPGTFEYNKNDKDLFLAVPFWRDWKVGNLNDRYFKLPSEEYVVLP